MCVFSDLSQASTLCRARQVKKPVQPGTDTSIVRVRTLISIGRPHVCTSGQSVMCYQYTHAHPPRTMRTLKANNVAVISAPRAPRALAVAALQHVTAYNCDKQHLKRERRARRRHSFAGIWARPGWQRINAKVIMRLSTVDRTVVATRCGREVDVFCLCVLRSVQLTIEDSCPHTVILRIELCGSHHWTH